MICFPDFNASAPFSDGLHTSPSQTISEAVSGFGSILLDGDGSSSGASSPDPGSLLVLSVFSVWLLLASLSQKPLTNLSSSLAFTSSSSAFCDVAMGDSLLLELFAEAFSLAFNWSAFVLTI